jgi:hypothetical protein
VAALTFLDIHDSVTLVDGLDEIADAAAAGTKAANQDMLVFVFNLFDELRRIAPVQKN